LPACLCYPYQRLLSAAAAHPNLKDVQDPRSGSWIAMLLPRLRAARLLLVAVEAPQLPRERLPDVVVAVVEAQRTLLLCRLFHGSPTNLNTASKPANRISAAWPRACGTSPIL